MAFLAESGDERYLFLDRFIGSNRRLKEFVYITPDELATVLGANYFSVPWAQTVRPGDTIRVIRATERNDLTTYIEEYRLVVTGRSGNNLTVIEAAVNTAANLANMATKTYKGRTSAGTGAPEDVPVATVKTDLALGNVDNTSDANKPISTAQQAALDLKPNVLTPRRLGAVGDGSDDFAEWQATIDAAEVLLAAGAAQVVIDGEGLNYGITGELVNDSGSGLIIQNAKFTALASAAWLATTYSAADIPDLIRTNLVLWNRDLTNAAWAKVTMTATKDQADISGTASSATRLTAGGANSTILQSITSASALRVHTAFVKRFGAGTGVVEMTMDNGSTWTALSPALTTAEFQQYRIPEQTLANPVVGFRIVTSGDEIIVDLVQNEVADGIPISTPPMLTTTAAVTRVVPKTYLLRLKGVGEGGTAEYTTVKNVLFECSNLCGGILSSAFSALIDKNVIQNVAGIGFRQEAGGQRVTNNIISQGFVPSGRSGIGIYAGQADGKFFGNICRYSAYPLYLGVSQFGSENGSTGVWGGNHFYNGHSPSNPDSTIIYCGTGANSNSFVNTYLDNGGVHLRQTDNAFHASQLAWGNSNAKAIFTFWTTLAGDDLDDFIFSGFTYPHGKLTDSETSMFAFRVTGSGTWAGINTTLIGALKASAKFSHHPPSWVSNSATLGRAYGGDANSYFYLGGLTTTQQLGYGVETNDLVWLVEGAVRARLQSDGKFKHTLNLADILYTININALGSAIQHQEGARTADVDPFAQLDFDNRGTNAYSQTGSTIAATVSWRYFWDGADNTARGSLWFSIGGVLAQRYTFGQKGWGYTAGMGGAVTQATSKATGVTLDKPTGKITMHAAALAPAAVVSFTFTNSCIAATDKLSPEHVSGGTGGAYVVTAFPGAGSAVVYVRNASAGSLSEAIVLRFAITKSADT